VALVYPNTYYLGMSNLGIHALYRLFNREHNVVCERVFLEEENREPVSLESGRPLTDFAVLAFSVSYELDYFNVLRILKAGGVPPRAADREERHPLIMAGGPCITANPVPLSPFFDCFCIGEAEAILPHLLPVLSQGLNEKRADLLQELARLPGVYVPSLPQKSVARQRARSLDEFPVGSAVLTPDTELGDLYLMEVERGCNWSCRFCLVSTAFKPMRLRSVSSLLEQAREGLSYRNRVGLVGPAVSDHPHLDELLSGLLELGAGFSISSLRVSHLSEETLAKIVRGGAKTITIAPEAGSERLRQAIRKGICEEDILRAVRALARLGVRQLKLYFMVGLPTETDDDIEEIISIVLKCKDILDAAGGGARLSLNVAPFVPKAGTSFQRLPMAPEPVLKHRLSLLHDKLAPQGIKLKSESPAWSEVQGVLSRGDAHVADVLQTVEKLSLAEWHKAAGRYRLDTDFYAHHRWSAEQALPWSLIDSGTRPDHLEAELNKALD